MFLYEVTCVSLEKQFWASCPWSVFNQFYVSRGSPISSLVVIISLNAMHFLVCRYLQSLDSCKKLNQFGPIDIAIQGKVTSSIDWVQPSMLFIWGWRQSLETVPLDKAIPVTGRGRPIGLEMLRIPHCLGNRLTVNCEILATCSSTCSPVRTSQEAHSVSIK
jgi:hypothetical protein